MTDKALEQAEQILKEAGILKPKLHGCYELFTPELYRKMLSVVLGNISPYPTKCDEPNCVIPDRCYHQGKPTLCGQLPTASSTISEGQIKKTAEQLAKKDWEEGYFSCLEDLIEKYQKVAIHFSSIPEGQGEEVRCPECGIVHEKGLPGDKELVDFAAALSQKTLSSLGESQLSEGTAKGLLQSPTDKWVSVEERLPESREKVLILIREDIILIGQYDSYSYDGWSAFFSTGLQKFEEGEQPTHWQPLPEAPAVNEK